LGYGRVRAESDVQVHRVSAGGGYDQGEDSLPGLLGLADQRDQWLVPADKGRPRLLGQPARVWSQPDTVGGFDTCKATRRRAFRLEAGPFEHCRSLNSVWPHAPGLGEEVRMSVTGQTDGTDSSIPS
jgi:hypothetical protein